MCDSRARRSKPGKNIRDEPRLADAWLSDHVYMLSAGTAPRAFPRMQHAREVTLASNEVRHEAGARSIVGRCLERQTPGNADGTRGGGIDLELLTPKRLLQYVGFGERAKGVPRARERVQEKAPRRGVQAVSISRSARYRDRRSWLAGCQQLTSERLGSTQEDSTQTEALEIGPSLESGRSRRCECGQELTAI
jgi:hypothetical protein